MADIVAIRRPYREGVLAWLHLVRIHNRISRAEAEFLAGYGLTVAQFDVLTRLAAEGGLSQQALAERLLVTKGNVCGLLDRMEASGTVERRPDPADRRSNRVYLTPAGQALHEAVAPELEAFVDSRFDALAPHERETLRRLLGQLDRTLE